MSKRSKFDSLSTESQERVKQAAAQVLVNKYRREKEENRELPSTRKITATYWCPPTEDWTGIALGSIRVAQGQRLDQASYLSYLGNRVQAMVDAEPNPEQAVRRLIRGMDQAGLQPQGPEDVEDAGNFLVSSNPLIPDYLTLMGVYLDTPVTVSGENPDAEKAYKEVTLDEWIDLLQTSSLE